MPANKMPEMPEAVAKVAVFDDPREACQNSSVYPSAGEYYTADQMRAMWLAGVEAALSENTKLREMLSDCVAYVAARDAYDHEADKYGHESNRGPMIKVRAAAMAAVKKYRAVTANLTALEQEAKK